MRRWRLWVACIGAAGCTRPNPAFGDAEGDTAGSASATGTATSSAATATVADATSVEGSTTRSDGSTTLGAVTSDDGPASTDTGTAPDQCWDSDSFSLSILVRKDGMDVGPCASSIDITGPVTVNEGSYFEVQHCGDCNPCGGAVYSFELAVEPPTGMFDPSLPACVNVITTAGSDMIAPDVCTTSGIVIRNSDAAVEPLYIGSAGELVPPVAAPATFDFDLVPTNMTCECRGGCCLMQPGLYRLAFPNVGVLGIDEGDSVSVPAGMGQVPYEFSNLGSHIHPKCGERPHVDYVIRRAG